jgi:hypothetical protein
MRNRLEEGDFGGKTAVLAVLLPFYVAGAGVAGSVMYLSTVRVSQDSHLATAMVTGAYIDVGPVVIVRGMMPGG